MLSTWRQRLCAAWNTAFCWLCRPASLPMAQGGGLKRSGSRDRVDRQTTTVVQFISVHHNNTAWYQHLIMRIIESNKEDNILWCFWISTMYEKVVVDTQFRKLSVGRSRLFYINSSCRIYTQYQVCNNKKLKNVSCEYNRLNGWNSTLQAAWYIIHVRILWFCGLNVRY